jgi:acyl-coenzyme A synthetase/AMP-(fatty) acid ligase
MSDFDQILQNLLAQHADIKELRIDTSSNSVAIATQGEALEEIKYSLREEKTNRAANCLRHDERLKEVENIALRLTNAYETLVKFGVGVITVGTFVIGSWVVIEKFWNKLSAMLGNIIQ